MNNEQAREAAKQTMIASLMQNPQNLDDVFNTLWDSAVEYARGGQWNVIYTGKDNPELIGWYLVSVLEMNDLGALRYTDLMSFGHRAEIGNCWFTKSDKQTVVAWQERPKPYTEAK